jgi:hypothetical protein
MGLIADQCRDTRTGLDNAIEGRRAIMALPMSQLTDRLVAIAITESLELGVNSARLTANRPREQQSAPIAVYAPVRDPV